MGRKEGVRTRGLVEAAEPRVVLRGGGGGRAGLGRQRGGLGVRGGDGAGMGGVGAGRTPRASGRRRRFRASAMARAIPRRISPAFLRRSGWLFSVPCRAGVVSGTSGWMVTSVSTVNSSGKGPRSSSTPGCTQSRSLRAGARKIDVLVSAEGDQRKRRAWGGNKQPAGQLFAVRYDPIDGQVFSVEAQWRVGWYAGPPHDAKG